MENKENIVDLGRVSSIKIKKSTHIPSRIQADTLFTFMTELKYLIPIVKHKLISPRYCDEDIQYLKITNLKKVAYPMKCFCDINLHRLEEHLYWYGYYGLAFEKEWGMAHKIQPIQYLNNVSELRKDFTKAFSAAIKADSKKETQAQSKMKSFLLNQMMYYKPYEGKFRNRNTGKVVKKCFTDECEWRFIPDVTKVGYEQVYFDENILNAGVLREVSNSMFGIPEISLSFEYEDLKYIIIKSVDDFDIMVREIESLKLGKAESYKLLSKVIIWDKSKGDF